ncbi:MAG: glycosyl hydrolase, partial [Clostridium sp.]
LDYSNEGENSWSEYKLQNNLDESINLNGYNVLTYDFIYDPSAYKKGSFKTKLFMKDIENENQKVETDIVIDLNNAEKLENGLKKVKVTIEFANKDINIQGITLGIIGSNTTYKGNIYIDNITLDQVAPKEVYVEKTAVPDNNQPKVTASELEVPSTVKLVDSNAIDAVGQLYGYLMGLGKSDKVIFGHQNDTHRKAIYTGGSESDTKDITGSISGIVGIDTLSFTGDELTDEQKSDADKRGISYAKKSAEIGRKTAQEGGILTVSAHMPNFALVKEKGKDKYGKYDYTNYSASTTYGNVVDKILPGGELNDVYTGYLDIIAEYAHELKDIPIIFRPFHENNGSWFWWGGSFCDSQTYKSLYAYTVEYLRDEKGVHNFLYVYSPNGPFKDADDYLSRYPGDEFVDVIAFDMYHENPSTDIENDPWFESLRETMELVDEIAKSKGKLSAATELGVKENGGGLSLSGNANKQWFKIVSDIISKSDMPYYMTWANFNTSDNFFAPFMADENKGHEMINDFIDYYNDENSVFANQIGDYTDTDTTISDEAYSYGYIVSPVSRIRILEPTTIKAKVKNIQGDVKFVLKDKEGKVLNTVQGKQESNEVWTAQITKEILDSIGEVNGTIELQAGDKTLNYIKALFNMKEPEKQPRVVDDFEGYMGDDSLLTGEWAPNVGPGCSVTPSLSTDHKKNGEFGLTFEYKISTAKTTEGYAGITKSVGSDWSGTDALQFWITPDGYGQKLIIQITSNGEEFEVNLKDIAATTEPQLVTIDFSEFKGKKGGKLGLSNIEKFGIYCNTIVPDDHEGAWTVNSKIYFDDIKAIDTNEVPSNGGNSSSGGSSSSGSSS